MTSSELIDGFRSAMREAGLDYQGEIIADGRIHRVNCGEEKGVSTWYSAHLSERFMAGIFGDWRRGDWKETWNSSKLNGTTLSKDDWRDIRRKMDESEKARRTEEEQLRYEAKKKSQEILSAAQPVAQHLYLLRKSVEPHGEMRVNKDNELCLPLRDESGVLQSLQLIAADNRYGGERNKTFIFGGKTSGAFYTVHDRTDGPIIICEGYATGATLFEATGYAVICAMFCGNLLPVGQAIRKKYPARNIIFAADNDRFTKDNPGKEKAEEAAKPVKGVVVIPEFADSDEEGTDFNDLAAVSGLPAVTECILSSGPMSFRSPTAILALNVCSNNSLLGDAVLSVGNIAAMLAPGGVGKSSLSLQMSAACAAGMDRFLTWDISPAMREMKWLFIQAENSAFRVRRDMQVMKSWLTPAQWDKFSSLVNVLVPLTETDSFLDLDQQAISERLRSAITFHNPDIVVFDALYNFSLRELSKGAEMLAAVSNCVRICKYGNPSRVPILLHHALPGAGGSARAAGFERANYGRDSKVLHQLCRSVINIVPASEDDNSKLLVTCGKCSDAKEFSPFVVQRNQETLIYEIDPDSDVREVLDTIKSPTRSKPDFTSFQVRQLCDVAGMTKSELARIIMAECGCSRRTGFNYIQRAISDNQLRYNEETKNCYRG